jgi:hypothetical protein
MAERQPDPKDVRVSMVDRGWSESPPVVIDAPPPPPLPKNKDVPPPPPLPGQQAEPASQRKSDEITRDETPDISELDEMEPSTEASPRELPMYEDSAKDFVTRVDDQMQARANAMTAELEDPTTQATVVAKVLPVAPVAAAAPKAATEPSSVARSSPAASAAAPPPPPPLPGARPQPPASAPTAASSPVAAPAPASTKSREPASKPPPSLPRPLVPVGRPSSPSAVPTAPAVTKPDLAPKVRTAAWPIPQPLVAPVASAAQSGVPSTTQPQVPSTTQPQVPPTTQPLANPAAQAPVAPVAQKPVPPALPVSKAANAAPAVAAPAPSFDSTYASGQASVTAVDQFGVTVVDKFGPVSSLRDVLLGRVRVANRPVPLWVVLAPVLVATAMLAALFVGVVGGGKSPPPEVAPAASGTAEPGDPSRPSTPMASDEGKPRTFLERAAAGEPTALSTLEQKKPKELGTDEALALARGKVARDVAAARKLRERLAADPGLAKDKKVIADLLRFAHGRETSDDALAAMAAVPGPLSADLVYEVWTGTAERSEATELARAILLGKDVRPKASPALAVALELREATTCEESQALLEKAIEHGDKRALVPINRLARKTGCGPNKRQDCYPCLRDGDLVKRAFNAVRVRREPEILR